MPRELARIRWTETDMVLDPNVEGFGVATWVVEALRSQPIRKGVLVCEACLRSSRRASTPSVHLRQHGDRLIVAHHASHHGLCYNESPEHEALKDRVVACAEGHGFQARLEQNTADRKGRADVEVIGPGGVRIGHEIQISAITTNVLSRRNNTALRDGRVPSWLTTDRSAHSATRNLIDRVPWAMSNRLHEELIRKGRRLQVSAGLSSLKMTACRYLPGWCPDNPRVLDCSGWHTRWDNVSVAIEDFVGHTAAGTYLPVSLPTDYRGVRRRWITPADRELYMHATGLELEPELPKARGGGASASGGGRSKDSLLHQGEEHEPQKKRAVKPRAKVSEVVRGNIVVGTLRELPEQARQAEAGTGQVDTASVALEPPHRLSGARAEQAWLEVAVAEPCAYSMGADLGRCESTPSRLYASGRRCLEHAPNPFTPMP
ncbi:competence protein CoiA family protein [Nocardiopsis terrae]